MAYNMNSGYGQALQNYVASQVPTFGRMFVLMNSSDTDEENYQRMQETFPVDPNGVVRFFTSLASAYAAMESNNNDVLLIDGNSAHSHTGELAISSNRAHFIGMDGGDRFSGQGAKVQSTAGTAAASVIAVSGTRNTFRNIKFIQADDEATSQNVLKESGESSLYKNCQFMFEDVDELDQTDTYEILFAGDSTEFHNCQIGADTLTTSAARSGVAFDKIGSARAVCSLWKDCIWRVQSSSADFTFVKVIATTDLAFSHVFVNPIFISAIIASTSAVASTVAVSSVSSLVEGNVLFVNPATNAASFSTTSDNFKVVGAGMQEGATGNATATIGVGLVPD
uniref:Pectinesterase n=1 Tax=viral metagenome TaxID=1070528 RepID=A0A6H1ZVR8_9ZZZZ